MVLSRFGKRVRMVAVVSAELASASLLSALALRLTLAELRMRMGIMGVSGQLRQGMSALTPPLLSSTGSHLAACGRCVPEVDGLVPGPFALMLTRTGRLLDAGSVAVGALP